MINKCLLIAVILLLPWATQGQSTGKDIIEQIKTTNTLLNNQKKSTQASIYELQILDRKVQQLTAYIDEMTQDIEELDQAIALSEDSVEQISDELTRLQHEYKQMVTFTYLNQDRYHPVIFILSSSTFNTAFKRMFFLRNYANQRKLYYDRLVQTEESFRRQKALLEERKADKDQLLAQRKEQYQHLNSEFARKENMLASLQDKENALRLKLAQQVDIAKKLDKQIAASILANLEPTENNDYEPSATEKNIRVGFQAQKGELIWPVNNGVILNRFGKQPHPVIKGVYIFNSGIDIGTLSDSHVHAVYTGRVVKIVRLPGVNYSVLIKHDDYYTLYSNLKETQVQAGQEVLVGDEIGIVDSDFQNDKQFYLKFQVWHKNKKLDPLDWLDL